MYQRQNGLRILRLVGKSKALIFMDFDVALIKPSIRGMCFFFSVPVFPIMIIFDDISGHYLEGLFQKTSVLVHPCGQNQRSRKQPWGFFSLGVNNCDSD